MIKGDDVKEAIGNELLRLFKNVKVYKEGISEPQYPHFFIYQINVADYEGRKNYHHFDYSIDVRYRVASDPSTVDNLQARLDDVSLTLLENFNIIKFNEDLIRCSNKRVEKVDNVLHFFLDCKILAKYVSNVTVQKFDKLDFNVEVKK